MAVDSGLGVPIGILAAHSLSAAARLVYTWLFAQGLASRGEGRVTADQATRALGLPAEDVETALNQLEDFGVIRLSLEGASDADLSASAGAAVPSPVQAPAARQLVIAYELTPLEDIDWTLLGAAQAVAEWAAPVLAPVAATTDPSAPSEHVLDAETPISTVGEPTPPPGAEVIRGTPDRLLTLDQRVQKYGLEPVLAHIYQKIGPAFTPEMVQMLVGWAEEDSFHFPPAVIRLIVEECANRGKLHPKYMQKVAEGWYAQGVRTVHQAQEMVARQSERNRLYQAICRRLNLARRLTQDEMDLCRKWVDDWGFSEEAVLAACGETVKTTSPSFRYIDAVLEAWYERRRTAGGQAGDAPVPAGHAATVEKGQVLVLPHPASRPRSRAIPDDQEKRRRQDYWGAYQRMIGTPARSTGSTGEH
ncbi:MAG: DnaD domain protein [Limnochordaceae bacterium]|nr:DnaD domain protein [Limnochordaceae bacterium]